MDLREKATREFTRAEARRVAAWRQDDSRAKKVLDVTDTLNVFVAALVPPLEVGVNVTLDWLPDSAVVQIENDPLELLVHDPAEGEPVAVYALGGCWRCEEKAPLLPPLDPDKPWPSLGAALHHRDPAPGHACRPATEPL